MSNESTAAVRSANTVVTGALENIRKLISEQEQVAFVVHFWMPFKNLGMNGFRFPQYPHEFISSNAVIPLVQIPQKHIDSFINPINNKVTPFETVFTQDIASSRTDLLNRFGKYGMVWLPELNCKLDEAEELIGAFDAMLSYFKGTLQDLPYFFGGRSVVEAQFDNQIIRLEKGADNKPVTYDKALGELLASGKISRLNYNRLMSSVNEFKDSVDKAHRAALLPQDGILNRSILAINSGQKDGLDEADIWLTRQFPDFKVSARLKGKSDTDSIDRLVNVLSDRLGNTPAEAAKQPAGAGLLQLIAAATDEEKEALRMLLGVNAQAQAESPPIGAPVVESDAASVDTEEEEPSAFGEVDDDEQQGLTPTTVPKCLGKTKGSNYTKQCQIDAAQDHLTCATHLDQEPDIIKTIEADLKERNKEQ